MANGELRALAATIIERDRRRDNSGTTVTDAVPRAGQRNASVVPLDPEASDAGDGGIGDVNQPVEIMEDDVSRDRRNSSAGGGSSGAPSFPPCPSCGQIRYWLARDGKVVCGARHCGDVRWILTRVEFHAVS